MAISGLGPQYCNLRGVVNDLVNRQAKFGSFNASVKALSGKYDTYRYPDNAETATQWQFYRNTIISPRNDTLVVAIAENSEGAGCKLITDCDNGITYKTQDTEHDKFIIMEGYDRQTESKYSVRDINNNGVVDPEDEIELLECGKEVANPVKMPVNKFLGNQ